MLKKTALYKQIQKRIREKIVSGQLRPADRISSEQELMDEFKVSKITVKNAWPTKGSSSVSKEKEHSSLRKRGKLAIRLLGVPRGGMPPHWSASSSRR